MVVDLQQAEEAIRRSDLKLAAQICKQAIRDDDKSHDANLWVLTSSPSLPSGSVSCHLWCKIIAKIKLQRLWWCRLGGRVAYFQGDLPIAEKLYRKATLSRNESIPALEGLASVQMGSSDFHSGAETYADLASPY